MERLPKKEISREEKWRKRNLKGTPANSTKR